MIVVLEKELEAQDIVRVSVSVCVCIVRWKAGGNKLKTSHLHRENPFPLRMLLKYFSALGTRHWRLTIAEHCIQCDLELHHRHIATVVIFVLMRGCIVQAVVRGFPS